MNMSLIIHSQFRNIVGCQLNFNQKMNDTSNLLLVKENLELQDCASECLNRVKCSLGWMYHSYSKKVGKINLIFSKYHH